MYRPCRVSSRARTKFPNKEAKAQSTSLHYVHIFRQLAHRLASEGASTELRVDVGELDMASGDFFP